MDVVRDAAVVDADVVRAVVSSVVLPVVIVLLAETVLPVVPELPSTLRTRALSQASEHKYARPIWQNA